MAFELMSPTIISICADCVYFNAYGRLDDTTMQNDHQAAEKHKAKIATEHWRWGTEFTSGCGRECPEHGIAAVMADFPHVEDWLYARPGKTAEDYVTAIEDEYDARSSQDMPEPWFSWSACEECGSTLGGDREHATAWMYLSPSEWKEDSK